MNTRTGLYHAPKVDDAHFMLDLTAHCECGGPEHVWWKDARGEWNLLREWDKVREAE